MCGISGIYALTGKGRAYLDRIETATACIQHRGPDHTGLYEGTQFAAGHARLSIVDISDASHQPFLSADGEQVLVFNGEIFNYKALSAGLDVQTSGDVEVLLKKFANQGPACLPELNGFFAFGFYNRQAQRLHVVRDRLGIKPLYYYADEDVFVFASEIKAIVAVVGKRKLNRRALYHYFRFNYIPGPESIFEGIQQVPAGHYLEVAEEKLSLHAWYDASQHLAPAPGPSAPALRSLMEDAIRLRLQADVPVGCFLSGGVDSSVISALAAKQHKQLHTFSIGFKDEPFFDETRYAEQVARHIGSTHQTFKLSNDDLLQALPGFLHSIDEPFADSSALNFYILSQLTGQQVKVSLSGDGADELFMGYNKHRAEWLVQHSSLRHLKPLAAPLLKALPKSRNSYLGNKFRQLERFYTSSGLSAKDRYLNWASISLPDELDALLIEPEKSAVQKIELCFRQADAIQALNLADLALVLADDMLVKVDRMSMRHGIEIRNPFLDYRIVELALGLPEACKINKQGQKLILREAFADVLPAEIFTRAKKGFEVPLLKWFNHQLRFQIETDWLSDERIREQNIFRPEAIARLKQQLWSANPGDVAAKIWALIVFQHWYAQSKDLIDA